MITAAALLAVAANAQTLNVHLKNGEIHSRNLSEVDYIDFSDSGVAKTPAQITIDGEQLSCGYAYIRHDEDSSKPDSRLYSLYFNSFDWFAAPGDSPLKQIAVFFWVPKDETLTDAVIDKFSVLVRNGDSKNYSNGMFTSSDEAQLRVSKKDDVYTVSIDNFAVSGKGLEKEETTLSFCDQVSSLSDDLVSEVFDNSYVYTPLEQMPVFPGGGSSALLSWVSRNIRYPAVAEENGIQGRVTCTFVVERDGSVADVKVTNSVDALLDAEAVRVLENMPSWVPGMILGEFVRLKYTIPINFKLQARKRNNVKPIYNPTIIVGDLERITLTP